MDFLTNTGVGVAKMTICQAGCEEAIFILHDIPKVSLGKTYFELRMTCIPEIDISIFLTNHEIHNLEIILDIKC